MNAEKRSGHAIAIGASAGGLTAIRDLIAELPDNLNAPIVIAVHSEPSSRLTQILSKVSTLEIKKLEDGEVLRAGCIYVVPGATHAFFRSGAAMQLSEVVQGSGFRPSIDAFFMSLAAEYGEKAIAVVLSGLMADGMRGSQVIYDMGGQTVVQNPKEAKFASMPASVINADHPQEVLSAKMLGRWLVDWVGVSGGTEV